MRATLSKSLALSLAALTVSVGLAASAGPAAAWVPLSPKFPLKPFPIIPLPPGPGPIHHHPGFGPGFGLGLGLGLVGGAVAASSAYYPPDPCIQYRPVYDASGNYLGRSAVNVCQ